LRELSSPAYARKNLVADVALGLLATAFLITGAAYHSGSIQGDKYPFTFGMGALDVGEPGRIFDVGVEMTSTTLARKLR
jgi:hypothetical protein